MKSRRTCTKKLMTFEKEGHCQSPQTFKDSSPETGVVGRTGHAAVQAVKAEGEKQQNQGAAAMCAGAGSE